MTSSVATSTKTKGVVALVAGIVSVVTAWLVPILGLIAGIVAVVLGFLSRKSEPGARTLSLWGLILGFVGIVLSVIAWAAAAMLVAQAINGA